jgi:hypothetical protein
VAIVVTGLMPNALVSGAETRSTSAVAAVLTWGRVELPTAPLGCSDASCGKGAPSPSAPTTTVVTVSALVGILALAALGRKTRRVRFMTAPLPRGSFTDLFHPPQFS